MKLPRWLPYAGIVAFFVTFIVIGRIWLSPLYTQREPSERVSAMRRWALVVEQVVYANERLRELTIRDSLRSALPRTAGLHISGVSDSIPVFDDPDKPQAGSTSLRALATRETGGIPKVAIHVVGVPSRYGGHPEVREGVWRRMFVSGKIDGDPYCAVVVRLAKPPAVQRFEAPALKRGGVLGQCAFWARYGAAGPHIEKWLHVGGSHFAGSEASFGVTDGLDRIRGEEDGYGGRFRLPLAGQACLAGRKDVCARAIANPQRLYGDPDSVTHLSDWDTRLSPGESRFLAAVEHEFGPERFQEFWTSAEPMEAAFENAFGVSLGTWVYKWLERFGPIERGARLGGDSIVLTVLLLGVCAGLALMTAQRRRV